MNNKFFWEPDDIVFDDDVALAYTFKQRALPGFKEYLHPRYRGKFIGKPTPATTADISNQDVERASKLIDKPLTKDDIAHLVGAQEGTRIRINDWGDEYFGVHSADERYYNDRTIYPDHIHNDIITVRERFQRKGLGTKILYEEVMAAKDLGFDYIDAYAARSSTFNGYATWPKLGYDGDVEDLSEYDSDDKKVIDYADKHGFTHISDFMKKKEDRDWWEKNGVAFEAKFDLHDEKSIGALQAAYDAVKNRR
jgi:GNAT superfamily N-acetyltransferase